MEKPSVSTVEGLRLALEKMGLNTKGYKAEIKQRYKKALKTQKETIPKTSNGENEQEEKESQPRGSSIQQDVVTSTEKTQPFDYYLFFDVEATCEENGGFTFPNEIIEFPIVLVSGETFDIIDEFRSYVKPTINPKLSNFCVNLTGITQSTVDESPDFIQVLNMFQDFLAKYGLFQNSSAAFVTDGPYDIRDFITKQCKHSKIKPRPAYFDLPWVNIRKTFRDFYNQNENKNIGNMLAYLKMKFVGREHSGLDDAKNLVAIGKRMRDEGCIFKTNCKYDPKRDSNPYNSSNRRKGRKRR